VDSFAGRLLANSDEHGPPALVVSFNLWKRALNSDPDAIGKVLRFDQQSDATHTGTVRQHSFTLIGIARPEFFRAKVGESPDFYVPLNATDFPTQDYWQIPWVTMLARLKPGVTIAQGRKRTSNLFCRRWKRLRRYPKSRATRISLLCSRYPPRAASPTCAKNSRCPLGF